MSELDIKTIEEMRDHAQLASLLLECFANLGTSLAPEAIRLQSLLVDDASKLNALIPEIIS